MGTVTPITFMKPVIFSCGGDIYVRSIRQVDADGTMHFQSAIEEGMVLELGARADMLMSYANPWIASSNASARPTCSSASTASCARSRWNSSVSTTPLRSNGRGFG